jgi:pimeloyl-ACP methyl ester carboxylesterase
VLGSGAATLTRDGYSGGGWTYTYRGQRHDDIHLSIALVNSGDVQLELIQQRCDSPSMYRDFLRVGREGMQHWSSWPVDYDAKLKYALANGYTIGQQGESPRGPFVYLWTPTLLLAPAQSPFVPLAVMQEMQARIAGSELLVFADARHGLPCSHGRECGRALRAFLDRL